MTEFNFHLKWKTTSSKIDVILERKKQTVLEWNLDWFNEDSVRREKGNALMTLNCNKANEKCGSCFYK